ncbi:hypothetical protein AWC38_SpisGene17796 [Stylophora pistillata]|uniref:Uncharacterized protein n=1 Tax=Stylophora pistillata TaxID=50429 RepID=A0A2B4RNF2_STYPI|nr:hypothetical protein AWC38_SpisGene17796 [Stylophora pistillata]
MPRKPTPLSKLELIKLLETHEGQGTTPSGLRIKRIQAKGHNVDEPQAKFDDIVREAELKLLEAATDHLCAEVKVHQEAVRSTTANIEWTIARWKVELLKIDITEDQASSLCVASSAFAEELSKDSAVSRASTALQTEIDRKEKHKSLVNMDVSEDFVPSETSIREIVRNQLHLSSGTTNRVDTSRQREVSIVHSGPHGKQYTQTGAKRNGLKFRPSLRPPTVPQFDQQIQDFCRRVRLQDKFPKQPQSGDFNPRLYVPTGWIPLRENPDLEDRLFALRKELQKSITAEKPHSRNNLSKQEREDLHELKSNPGIKILPTDKNLGPALLSTDWVQAETLRHLYDELSYRKVTQQDCLTVPWLLATMFSQTSCAIEDLTSTTH